MNRSQIRSERKKGSKIVTCFLFLIIIGIILAVGAFVAYNNWYLKGISSPNSDSNEIVSITIPSGTSSKNIGVILHDNGLIKNATIWDLYIRMESPALFAGEYALPKNLSIEEIVGILSQAPQNKTVRITFREGLSYSKMAEIIEANEASFDPGAVSVNQFIEIAENPDNYTFSDEIQTFLDTYKPEGKSLEGFLYPNTYDFKSDITAVEFIEKFLAEFINQVSDLNLDSGERSFYETLTLASIVEQEGLTDDDREIIAGVFNNRLIDGILLQSDATVNYATGKNERRSTFEDLKVDSPYNTYKYAGLPPTPINNPRLNSIEVSLSPIDTDYYYFIHEEDGTPHYGKTLADHNSNVARYLDN
jgi:UPF0755 protein